MDIERAKQLLQTRREVDPELCDALLGTENDYATGSFGEIDFDDLTMRFDHAVSSSAVEKAFELCELLETVAGLPQDAAQREAYTSLDESLALEKEACAKRHLPAIRSIIAKSFRKLPGLNRHADDVEKLARDCATFVATSL